MIKSWRHKGLKLFFETGSKAGINPQHAAKLARQLDRLDAAVSAQDMNLPGWKLHPLKGKEQNLWSIWANGNWRVTFAFEGEHVILVDYQDYH